MSGAFSTPAEHAFDHPELEVPSNAEAGPSSNGDALRDASIEEAFEVEDTVRRIVEGGYKTIGLQFPDELLPSSVPVYRAVQRGIAHTGAQAYVLADSTYGSCCPDVLSCLHIPADFLVHYGHACLTPLPVHYVFPRQSLDVADAAKQLQNLWVADKGESETGRQGVVVVWDVAYDWLSESVVDAFSTAVATVPISFATIQRPRAALHPTLLQPDTQPTSSAQSPDAPDLSGKQTGKTPSLRRIDPPPGLAMRDCSIYYIGPEGRALLNLQMQNADSPIYHYSPPLRSAACLTSTTSRHLQRRLRAIHHAVASDIFGLVAHSVGLSASRPLLAALRALLKRRRKKSYTLTVGRLNPAKLANFEVVECFVLVGCQEGGLVDSKDFLRPIITPWELLLALQGPEHAWEPGKWTLDIAKVLAEAEALTPAGGANDRAISAQPDAQDSDAPEGRMIAAGGDGDKTLAHEHSDADGEDDEDAPVFSLVSGTYKSRRLFGRARGSSSDQAESAGGAIEGSIGQMTLRNNEFSLAKLESAGSNYLASRHFQGLEVRRDEDETAILEEGRSGIARGYEEER